MIDISLDRQLASVIVLKPLDAPGNDALMVEVQWNVGRKLKRERRELDPFAIGVQCRRQAGEQHRRRRWFSERDLNRRCERDAMALDQLRHCLVHDPGFQPRRSRRRASALRCLHVVILASLLAS